MYCALQFGKGKKWLFAHTRLGLLISVPFMKGKMHGIIHADAQNNTCWCSVID